MFNKKGMELGELGKILLALVLLAILVLAVVYLFKGKGGELLSSIRNALRFGQA